MEGAVRKVGQHHVKGNCPAWKLAGSFKWSTILFLDCIIKSTIFFSTLSKGRLYFLRHYQKYDYIFLDFIRKSTIFFSTLSKSWLSRSWLYFFRFYQKVNYIFLWHYLKDDNKKVDYIFFDTTKKTTIKMSTIFYRHYQKVDYIFLDSIKKSTIKSRL